MLFLPVGSLSLCLKKQLVIVLNLYTTTFLCTPAEISQLHLQRAHLLIRPDPGDWLALLFSVQAIEICLSFFLDGQTHICVHTHIQAETHRHTCLHCSAITSSLRHLFGWLEGYFLWYRCRTAMLGSLLFIPQFFIQDGGIEGNRLK